MNMNSGIEAPTTIDHDPESCLATIAEQAVAQGKDAFASLPEDKIGAQVEDGDDYINISCFAGKCIVHTSPAGAVSTTRV